MNHMRAMPSMRLPIITFFPNGKDGMPVLPPSFQNPLTVAPAAPAPPAPSRSPSPVGQVGRRPGQRATAAAKKVDYEAVKAELAKNGFEHIAIDGQVGGVQEMDIRVFLERFQIDQVCVFWFSSKGLSLRGHDIVLDSSRSP